MFGKRKTNAFTGNCSAGALRAAIEAADAVVIGAGAGLSAAAGMTYDGERFHRYFADFEEVYGFRNMYSGGFYPYDTPEEYWAYWSRYIFLNRYCPPPKPTYENLLRLMEGKDYFVITTNVDHCFQRAGFDKKRLFYTQGDYGLFQCSAPCCAETWDNEAVVRQMVAEQEGRKIPTRLIPRCPHCGRPAAVNLRADDTFAEDEGWHLAAARYADFLRTRHGQRVLFLELGVGYNTPGIIKYPFWQMAAESPRATYACVNQKEAYCPPPLTGRALCLTQDIDQVISACVG